MSTYETTHTIALPEDHPDAPLDVLADFFVHNGYMPRVADDATDTLTLTRGTPGAGWRISEMSGLGTTLTLQRDGDEVRATYVIDIRGQHLNDAERGFWRREARAAQSYLESPDPDHLVDLRDQEATRARVARQRMRRTGMGAAIAAFIIVTALYFLLSQLGLVHA
ncbi:hypothetical protein FRC96_18525 [Lujinxingia vulgaris]|uniref:Uncharacterized protein n=1 Tax=Lujinxingia vulgaris TaxID=2600176 RepID=A0A5C6X6G8_9DELT|nr:hypothetical protein [Lujinxingia vulgaris]TXD32201.1 hypothetical protein FRC96_18525 [Lujinxingia vulgaris]